MKIGLRVLVYVGRQQGGMHMYLDVDILQTDTDRLVVSSFTMRLDTVNEVVKVHIHFLCAFPGKTILHLLARFMQDKQETCKIRARSV